MKTFLKTTLGQALNFAARDYVGLTAFKEHITRVKGINQLNKLRVMHASGDNNRGQHVKAD